jgi:hypothetical protein
LVRCRWGNQEENDMMLLLSRTGLRYKEKNIASGAQTERRGVSGPGRDLLGDDTSPTASALEKSRSDLMPDAGCPNGPPASFVA